MTLKKVGVEFAAQGISPFVQAVTSGNTAVQQFGTTATRSAKSTDDLAAAQKRALNIADLTDKIGLHKTKLANLNDELEKTKIKYGESSAQAHRKEEAIASLSAKITSGERALDSYQQQIQREYQEQQKATQAAQQAAGAHETLQDQLNRVFQTQQKATQATQDAVPAVNKLENSTQALAKSTDHATSKISAFSEMATGAFRRVGEMAVNFAADAGRALIGLGGDTITVAADYETTLNRFSSVTLDAMDEAGLAVKDFDKMFMDLGKSTQFSAQEAANAGVELAKGGIELTDILGGATEATLDLAAAAELELAPAAEIIAKALGAWGDTGVTAVDVSNLLTQAANASSTTVEELARGLSNVGGIAELAGVEFNEVVTALALIAPNFASSAEAGTALRSMLQGFTGKTKPARDAMAEIGLLTMNYQKALDFLITNGLVPAGTALADLADPAEEIDAGFRQFITATTGAQQGTDKFDKALGKLQEKFSQSTFFDAEGNFIGMAGAANELSKSLSGLSEQDKLKALDAIFGVEGGQAAAALAQEAAAGFNAMGESMVEVGAASEQAKLLQVGYNHALEEAKGSFENLQISIGRALLPTLTDLLQNHITPGINKLFDFTTAVTSAADPFDYLAGAAGRALAHFGPFGTTLQNLINIFIRGQDTFANWEFLERSLNAAFDQLLAFGGRVGSWILTSIPGWVADFGGLIGGFAVVIVDHIPQIMTGLGDVLIAMGNWVTANAPIWGQNLLIFGQYAVSWISDKLPMLGEELGKFFNRMVNWVVEKLPIWGAELAKLGEQAIQWVTDALPGLGTNLGEMAGVLLRWIGQTIIDVGPKLIELGNTFLNWIVTDVIPQLPGVAAGIWNTLNEFIEGMIAAAIPELGKLADEFYNWIPDTAIPKLKTGLALIWSDITTWVSATVRDIPAKTKEIGKQLIQGMVDGVKGAVSGLVSAVTGALSETVNAAKSFLGIQSPSWVGNKEIGAPFVQGITEGVTSGAGGLADAITSTLGSAMDAGQAITSAGSAAITGGMQSLLNSVQSTVGQIAGAWARASTYSGGDPSAVISAPAQGYSIQPVRPSGSYYSSTIDNSVKTGPTYAPTYNSPAPPPAMSYATLNAMAGVI